MTPTTTPHRSEAAPNPDDASWLVLRLPDGSELWTSCAALRRNGLTPALVATLLERRCKLSNPKKAKVAEAVAALSVIIIPSGANLIDVEGAGHA